MRYCVPFMQFPQWQYLVKVQYYITTRTLTLIQSTHLRSGFIYLFYPMDVKLIQYSLLKRLSFLNFYAVIKNQLAYLYGFISGFSLLLYWLMYLSPPPLAVFWLLSLCSKLWYWLQWFLPIYSLLPDSF